MISSHSVMTLGPKIVRILEASRGLADQVLNQTRYDRGHCRDEDCPAEPRGYARLSATARPNKMNVAAAKMKLNRLANAKFMFSLTWTRQRAVAFSP